MYQASIHEAKTHLSRLIQQALSGERVVIARGSEPVIELTPIVNVEKPRRLGVSTPVIEYMADDFDEPLDDFKEYM